MGSLAGYPLHSRWSLIEMGELIAVAVDGTPAGQSALALAGKIARRIGADISILCTIDAAYSLETQDGMMSREDRTEYPAPANEQIAARSIVDSALRDMRALGLVAQGAILAGSPAREIVAAAKRLDSSMIVMGHRHLSWFDRMLHPSICWDVLEHADCPVLVSMEAA
jgi:nucleotide-binding universal stress UspA family protein